MTQESRTQDTPTPAPELAELTSTELAQVVGGTEGPGGPTDGTYETLGGGRTVPITVPS